MKLFYQLEAAITFSKNDPTLAVFSKEHGFGGKRHFLVCSREEFWKMYQNIPFKKYYEVILSEKPCKLYFDLEFDISLNRSKEEFQLTKLLIDVVMEQMMENFGIETSSEDLCVLDSSSEYKFSVHVIFRLVIERNSFFPYCQCIN